MDDPTYDYGEDFVSSLDPITESITIAKRVEDGGKVYWVIELLKTNQLMEFPEEFEFAEQAALFIHFQAGDL